MLFVPGVTAAVLIFLVFGTTKTFRDYMWELFVPAPLRRRYEARSKKRKEEKASVSASSGLGQSGSRRAEVGDEEQARGRVVMVGLQDVGNLSAREEGYGKNDEWPIMKPNPHVWPIREPDSPALSPTRLSPPPWRR